MPHVRESLRAAVVTAVTGLATTGANVFTGRVYPVQPSKLPALEVNTIGEDAEALTVHGPGLIERRVTVEITGVARAASDVAGTLDDIAAEVETVLSGAITVSSKSVPLNYIGMEMGFADDAEQPTGRIALRYEALLYTLANAPGTLVQS